MNNVFPLFRYEAEELSAYIFCADFFVISLVNKMIVHFHPDDVAAFRKWLDDNRVKDITHVPDT